MREAMRMLGVIAASFIVAGCATGDTVAGQGTGSGSSSGGNGGSGGGTTTSRNDAIPQNGIGFFQMPACPSGWEAFKAASGRAILPTIGTSAGGATVGDPLVSGEERMHSHTVTATFALTDISYAGVVGGGNNGVTKAGNAVFSTVSEPASALLPYVQFLACKKVTEPVAATKPLPTGMQLFFDSAQCPSGWKQAPATQGRFIVGLPNGAPADVAFGAEPLSAAAPRMHSHGTTIQLDTTSHGIALAAGCCGSGYGKNGSYSSQEATSESDAAMPWIELLHCEKL